MFIGTSPTTDANMTGEAWDQATTDVTGAVARVGSFEDQLENGADDYLYTTGEFQGAMDLFLDTEETDIDFVLMGGSMASETDTKAKATKVIAIADGRKDCIAFVSAHKANQIASSGNTALTSINQKENTIAFFDGLASTSYAVFDSGYKYVYDRFSDKYRYIPCNGDIAGLCVQTSNVQEDWYSPAGLNRGGILNAVKMAYNPNKADRDELYQSRINPVTSLKGQGTVLFGDKTALAAPSAFDRINVRRLFLNLEKRARVLAEGVLFELNDATTRSGFASALNSYLSEVQARRGVTDYLVVCDESNNTSDVIDRNEFVAEIYVKPTRSINFITVTFTATKTGVSFSEVVGR
jgi:phage tail sheath protein FI